jgi:hypothetical protein
MLDRVPRSDSRLLSAKLPLVSPKVDASSFSDLDESAKRSTAPVMPAEEEENCLLGFAINSKFSKLSSVSRNMDIS